MPNIDKPLHSIPSSKKATYWMLAGAVSFALLALLQFATDKAPIAAISGLSSLLCAITLVWHYRASIVRVYEDGLEVKLAPLAPRKFAGFESMASVRETKKHIFVKLLRGKGKKEIKIPRFALESEDQDWLVEKLKHEIAAC